MQTLEKTKGKSMRKGGSRKFSKDCNNLNKHIKRSTLNFNVLYYIPFKRKAIILYNIIIFGYD